MFVIGYMPQTSMYTPVSAGPFTPTQQQTAGFAAPAAGSYIGTSTPSANLSSGFTEYSLHLLCSNNINNNNNNQGSECCLKSGY